MVCSFSGGISTLNWFDLDGNVVRKHEVKDSISNVVSSNDFVLQATHFATGLKGIYRITPNKTTLEVRSPEKASLRDHIHWKQDGHQFICYQVVDNNTQKTYSIGALCLNMDTHFERVWNHTLFTPNQVDRGWVLKKLTSDAHELVLSTTGDSTNCALVVRASPPINSLRIWPMNTAQSTAGLSSDIKWIGVGDFDSDLFDEVIGIRNQNELVIADGYFQNVVYSKRLGAPFSKAGLKAGMLNNDNFTDIVFSFSTKTDGHSFYTLVEPARNQVSAVGRTLTDFFDVYFLQPDSQMPSSGLLHAVQETASFNLRNFDWETGKSQVVLSKKGVLVDWYPLDVPASNFLHLVVLYKDAGKLVLSVEKTDQTYFKFF